MIAFDTRQPQSSWYQKVSYVISMFDNENKETLKSLYILYMDAYILWGCRSRSWWYCWSFVDDIMMWVMIVMIMVDNSDYVLVVDWFSKAWPLSLDSSNTSLCISEDSITLSISSASTKANTQPYGPGSTSEEKNRSDNTKSKAKSSLD